jgi:uncharacterized spore protein YtfJ
MCPQLLQLLQHTFTKQNKNKKQNENKNKKQNEK